MGSLLFYFMLLQFVIQLVLYESMSESMLKINEKTHSFVRKMCSYDNKLSKFLKKTVGKVFSRENIIKFTKVEMFAVNAGISYAVAWFCGAGMITGITNLFASCILGLVMAYDINKCNSNMVIAESM